jgi:hypothetical protein
MRNFDEATITDAVLQRVRAAKDDRIRQVSEALVRHLHTFVREIEPTQAEWEAGIDFLTRTGQMCDDKRQEFILLSDTLGVSMLVDAINHRAPEGATETTVLGPFYVQRAPEHPLGADISGTMEGAPYWSPARYRRLAASRWPARWWTSGIRTMTAITTCSSSMRSASWRCARDFAPTKTAGSGPSSRRPIRSRMTDRSAKCSRRRAATPGARPMSIS